jgi:hypothetical protein
VIYLLYTEDCNPYIRHLQQNRVTIEGFRQWCRERNGEIAYWNKRWGTDYTWDNLMPLGTKENSKTRQTDYWRWSAAILRERHGHLAQRIKQLVGPHALVGYHDWCIIPFNYADGESPLPEKNPYDFLSISRYYGYDFPGGQKGFEQSIDGAIANSRQKYPALPLAMLECGTASYEVGFGGQAEIVDILLQKATSEKIGINIWMWQDFLGKANTLTECSFGFLTPAGAHKPAYEVLNKRWKH